MPEEDLPAVEVRSLGCISYQEAIDLQLDLVARRRAEERQRTAEERQRAAEEENRRLRALLSGS